MHGDRGMVLLWKVTGGDNLKLGDSPGDNPLVQCNGFPLFQLDGYKSMGNGIHHHMPKSSRVWNYWYYSDES